jgi:hypothetical protein
MERNDNNGWSTTFKVANNTTDGFDTKQKYKVGYRKPPVHTQFKQGKSGNPKGRPKVPISGNALIQKILKRKRQISVSGEILQVTNQEALYLSAFARALKGDAQATKMFYVSAVEEEFADRPFKTEEVRIVLVGVDGKDKKKL